MRFWLYRIYDPAGQCLYIGVTSNGLDRLNAHGRKKCWWPEVSRIAVAHYATRLAVEAAERDAIRAECPLYNGTFAQAGQLSLSFEDPGAGGNHVAGIHLPNRDLEEVRAA